MPLIKCPECDREVSGYAESCPNCGRFFQNLRPIQALNTLSVVPSKGWSWAVAGGIVLSYVVGAIIGGFLFIVLLGGLAGLGNFNR